MALLHAALPSATTPNCPWSPDQTRSAVNSRARRPAIRVGSLRSLRSTTRRPPCRRALSITAQTTTLQRPAPPPASVPAPEPAEGGAAATSWVYVKLARPKDRAATALTVDGGGSRGMMPSAVLVEVEKIIKQHILECWESSGLELTVSVLSASKNGNELEERDVTSDEEWFRKELKNSDPNATLASLKKDFMDRYSKVDPEFGIRLPDYFDLCAGTSTGSLIATYLATGGMQSLSLIRSVSAGIPGPPPFPGSAAALVAMFQAKAHIIFPPPFLNLGLLAQLKQLFGSKYTAAALEGVLRDAFGNANLAGGVLPGAALLVTAFELARSRPITFFSLPPSTKAAAASRDPARAARLAGVAAPAATAVEDDYLSKRLLSDLEDLLRSRKDAAAALAGSGGGHHGGKEGVQAALLTPWGMTGKVPPIPLFGAEGCDVQNYRSEFVYRACDVPLLQVVRSSAAAPTYLPSETVTVTVAPPAARDGGDGDGAPIPVPPLVCIDGGVAANNPAPEALALLKAAGHDIDRVAILSLGTGISRKGTSVPASAGALEWVTKGGLLGIIMDSSSTVATAQLEFMSDSKGWPYVLRINKIVWKDPAANGADKDQSAYDKWLAGNPDPLSTIDLSSEQDMKFYAEMGHKLVDEDNGLLVGMAVDAGGKHEELKNRKLIREFVCERIFRDFATHPLSPTVPSSLAAK